MVTIEQLVYGQDPERTSQGRTLLAQSPGMGHEVAGEIQRLCDGWGQAPELGLQHPALMSFPLERTMSSLRGRLYAVIRIGKGHKPLFRAAVLSETAYAAFDYNPFGVAATGLFDEDWRPGLAVPRKQLRREGLPDAFEPEVSGEDVGVVDESVRKLLSEGGLKLPIAQSVGQSDRTLALILAALPPSVRKGQRFASFAVSDLNAYTLAARETEGTSCAAWKRWLLAQPDAPLDPDRAAYVREVREALIAGSLDGLAEAVRTLERGGPRPLQPHRTAPDTPSPGPAPRPTAARAAKPAAPVPRTPAAPVAPAVPRAGALPASRPAVGPDVSRMTSRAAPRPTVGPPRGVPDIAPRRPRSLRPRLVKQPVRIAQVGRRRLPSSIAMTVVFVTAALAAYAWLSHGGADGGFGWAVLRDRFTVSATPRATGLLDVVQVGRIYDRLVKQATRSGLAGLVEGGQKDRLEMLAVLQEEAATPLLQQGQIFRELAAGGIQQGDRPDRESQRLSALSEQGQVLVHEMSRLELAWVSLATGGNWRDLNDLSDAQIRARRDSLLSVDPGLLKQARRELGTGGLQEKLASAQTQVAAMRQLMDLFHADSKSPTWEDDVYAAAERINPSASGLTRAYRNAAFVMVRLKKAEQQPAHRALPYAPDFATVEWPSAAVRDILPSLRAQLRKFGNNPPPPLLKGAVWLYQDLAAPGPLSDRFAGSPDALEPVENNPAYRFDPAVYQDYIHRVRFETARRLLHQDTDPETVPAVYFVDPTRRADEEFRAALDAPRDPSRWEDLAAGGGPSFFTRWAGREAQRLRTRQGQQRSSARSDYEACRSLLPRLGSQAAAGADWTGVWLDLRDRIESGRRALRGSGPLDESDRQRLARMEQAAAALSRPRELPLTAVTVRFRPDALGGAQNVRLRLQVEPEEKEWTTEPFPVGPAAPAGSGWVGTKQLDWKPLVGPEDGFTATVTDAASGETLLEVDWAPLVDRAGPAALTRPRDGDSGSVLFRLDPAWWKQLTIPVLDPVQPETAPDVYPSTKPPEERPALPGNHTVEDQDESGENLADHPAVDPVAGADGGSGPGR